MHINLSDPVFSEVYQRMSRVIADIIRAKGSCCRSDMESSGFSGDEIRSCWAVAYGLAHVELMNEQSDLVLH